MTDRAEFEAWARKTFVGNAADPIDLHARPYALMWDSWQAARRSPPAQAGAGVVEALRELCTLEADGNHASEGAIEAWERARAALSAAPHPAGAKPTAWLRARTSSTEWGAFEVAEPCSANAFPVFSAAPTPPQPAAQPGEAL